MGSKPSKLNGKQSIVGPASRNPKRSSDLDALSNSNLRSRDAIDSSDPSNSMKERQSPERRGFNNPLPARQSGSHDRAQRRQTRMLGAQDVDGVHEDLDERPFRQGKVNRVPTKALLKPPKNQNSIIENPDEDYKLY
ncbi:hypothetical protein Q4I28_004778 [Leishmania naiffi]|uniref:Uncharacterized protein n=1 Tax=Leishmania naiffi TaxID=5678 RepID=A0AAW3BMQ9_9TRYP